MSGTSFTFDDVYLGDIDIGAIVQEAPVPVFAGVPRIDFRQVAYGKPYVQGSDSFAGGEMVVRVLLPGRDFEDSERRRAILMKVLSRPDKNFIAFDEFHKGVKFKGKLLSAPPAPYLGAGIQITLTFGIDPFRYLDTDYAQAVAAITDPITFNVPLVGVVPGNAIGHPVWLFQNTSGGTLNLPITITNNTTNEEAVWQGNLFDTRYLQFDATQRLVIETGTSPSSLVNAMSGFVGGGVIPTIEGGVQNSITVDGFEGTLAITLTPETF